MQNMKSCRCPHHSLSAIFLVLLALTLVLGNAGVIAEHTASMIWPIFLALIGLQMLVTRRCKCCSKESCKCGCCSTESKECSSSSADQGKRF